MPAAKGANQPAVSTQPIVAPGEVKPNAKVLSVPASSPAIASLNKLRSAREVIEFARRTDDPVVQEYAIWSVTRVCRALRFATAEVKRFQAFGASKPERTERVLKQLMAEYQSSADSARERCTDFEGSDDLQKQLAAEVERNRLPLASASAAIGELSRGRIPADVAINEARSQLDKVLAGNETTAMMSVLSFPIARTMRTRMQAEFQQTAAEDWPLGPLVAAYHLAACRMQQLDCGAGSIERDVVCAQYGECRAPDVEASYRRLFLLYGIPFADTDRLANKLSAAMLARDTAVLMP